jgi:hypothetical protein
MGFGILGRKGPECDDVPEPIVVDGRAFDVVVVRKRLRNAYARVVDGRVMIRIPERLGARSSREVVDELRERISEGMRRNPSRYLGMPRIAFNDGQTVEMFGRSFTIRAMSQDVPYARGRLHMGELLINLPDGIPGVERDAAITRLSVRMITRALEGDVRAYVEDMNGRHFNSDINRVRIRANTVLWGSCSPDNSISLNFRLLYAPKEMLEYVVLHELAHTKVRNHSRRFWALVGSIIPDYKERRRWLRNNAHTITPGATHGPA